MVVVLAKDAQPLELLCPVVRHCEEQSIPYCFVDSQACLGRACGISRPVICSTLIQSENTNIQNQIDILKEKVEMLFYD